MIDSDLINIFKSAETKILLLDYDGTLVPYQGMPGNAVPTTRIVEVLAKHIQHPNTDVSIVTGRMHQEIDLFLGHLPIDIVAEHGAFKKEKGKWRSQLKKNVEWKKKILPIFNKALIECPNSFIEEKQFSIAWHYRNVEEELSARFSKELIKELDEISWRLNLKVLDGNKVVEIMDASTDKGSAISKLVEAKKYDCILCIGDDVTDESMFSYLKYNKRAITIKVGKGETLANYKLDSVDEVILFLDSLA